MESANYKMGNGLLYKWEDNNHGLEHKCGTCKTVLSSPRAKKTCFGVHEEVCTKYHKTLFYLGNSHKCDACRKSMELHETRHREIATIVQRIQLLDETAGASITGPLHGKKRKPKKNDVLELYEVDFDRACDVEETNGGMEASTICEEESDMKRPRMSDTQEVKNDNKKAKKAEKRMVKNRARIKVITAEEVRRIREALHPTHEQSGTENTGAMRYVNDGLLNNSTINNNIAFNTNTFSYGSLRQQVHIKKLSKARGISPTLSNSTSQDSSALPLILCRLGLSVTKMVCSKDRKAFMSKLKEAIQSDLVTTENEERDTMKRMAGYWRYVNKRTYNCMVRNNELWDWRTGAKLEEIEEEDEEEGSQLENQEVAVTDAVAGDEVEKYDDDFVLGPGALKLANRDSFDEGELPTTTFEGVKDSRHLPPRQKNLSLDPEPISPLTRRSTVQNPRPREGTYDSADSIPGAEEATDPEGKFDDAWSHNSSAALSALSSEPPIPLLTSTTPLLASPPLAPKSKASAQKENIPPPPPPPPPPSSSSSPSRKAASRNKLSYAATLKKGL